MNSMVPTATWSNTFWAGFSHPQSENRHLPFVTIWVNLEQPAGKNSRLCLVYPALSWLRVHYGHINTQKTNATTSNIFWAGSSHPQSEIRHLLFVMIWANLEQPAGKKLKPMLGLSSAELVMDSIWPYKHKSNNCDYFEHILSWFQSPPK